MPIPPWALLERYVLTLPVPNNLRRSRAFQRLAALALPLSVVWTVRILTMLIVLPVVGGCSSLFGSDFTLEFDVMVEQVEEVATSTGTEVVCSVVITATAVGSADEMGTFGESVWTLRSAASGTQLSREARSAAFMGQIFRTIGVDGGESASTSPIERTAAEPFEWVFDFNYRDPGRSRQTTSKTANCTP